MGIFNKKAKQNTANSSVLRIVLEHSGTMLYELNTAEYTREIIIGRGAGCTWTLEGVDSSASSRHAVISKRKNNFYVTDLGSRNGIYYQNKRVSERKLALGDRISLGECTIIVEVYEEKNKRISQFHRLEYMDAKGHKTTIDINKAQMIIGSAPTCDIIFQNQLISSQHAELLLRSDGSCWIRDLNSRNGTSVNNMELTMDGERMLQDNDIINIAYLEIRFLDAAVEHHESRLWPTIITLAITVLVIMAGYTDEIEHMMKGNVGLASRMPFTVDFPNFTREQLYQIFVKMIGNKLAYDEDMLVEVKAYFDELTDAFINAKEFSNARFVRNLFERTYGKAALRCQLSGETELKLTAEDFKRASSDKEFKTMKALNTKKTARIGFGVSEE